MKTLYNINDIHAGVVRSAGTTPFSALQLRQEVINGPVGGPPGLVQLLAKAQPGGDLIINGDLFDTNNVALADLWDVVKALSNWLSFEQHSHSGGPNLYLPRGNHDANKNSAVLSSFDMLCQILEAWYPSQVHTITQPTYIKEHDAWVIPHLQNQDLFDAALADVPECNLLFVHVNYDNKFAVEADHSLNMSIEQARACKARHIIFGHEHQSRTALDRKVLIVGNQIPTSIADCLGNDKKFMLQITSNGGAVEWVPVWEAKSDFIEMDWRELNHDGDQRFIRVVGNATAAEAANAVALISRFRTKSKALVISNAVRVEGMNDTEELALNAENIAAFDVEEALMEILTEEERVIVRKLRNPEPAPSIHPGIAKFLDKE